MLRRNWFLILALLMLPAVRVSPSHAQETPEPERGAYLATIAGCQYCHSPADGPAFSGGVIQRGGRTLYAPNLTPAQNGLATWSDDDIRQAITTGIAPHGRQLDPVMPYLFYNGIADADLDVLIAYLKSLEPVETASQPANDLSGVTLPAPPVRSGAISTPDPADQVVYGRYLTENVMACGSCHTPTLADGEPDPERTLAGGQAFSGEWGTVYASNLTPARIGGVGLLSDEQIILAIISGQNPEMRPLYAMPWQAYSNLTGPDTQAVVAYLRSLPPVDSEIPPARLNAGYEQYQPTSARPASPLSVIVTILVLLFLGGLSVWVMIRQVRQSQRIRETDWAEYFTTALDKSRDKEEAQKASPHEEHSGPSD